MLCISDAWVIPLRINLCALCVREEVVVLPPEYYYILHSVVAPVVDVITAVAKHLILVQSRDLSDVFPPLCNAF